MRYLKAEIYKFVKSKTIFISLLVIILYALYGNYVFYSYEYDINILYNDFYLEYLPLVIFLSLIYIVKSFSEELSSGIIDDLDTKKMLNAKLTVGIFYLVSIYLLALIFSLFISNFIFSDININLDIIVKKILFILPNIIFYNLLGILSIVLFRKEIWGFGISFVAYLFINYVNGIILLKDNNKLLHIFTLNLDYNNVYINRGYTALNILGTFFVLYFLIIFLLKQRR